MALQNTRVPKQCINCGCLSKEHSKVVKNGHQNGIQRFRCQKCGKSFQEKYKYNAYLPNTDTNIAKLLCEGVGILGISRILKISKNTVASRMLKIASRIEKPIWQKANCTFQMDELWTFIKNKRKNATYITYCIEKQTGQVLGFGIGQRSYQTIRPIVEQLLKVEPKSIYTDKLAIYKSLIPHKNHKVFQFATNKIERNNLNLRTHIKRLSRKTICYSKSEIHLEAHLKIYFWG
ncbi:MAG: transposase [Muricauda sp.]|nr:IS1 family transposase [Allomuricauda sp.]MBC31448.1 transposase [Allomuricauda sp.]|tara:strand:+ start:187 stop:888 length:702 start_codon:yes stop_codon:yes gene_type:complete